MIFILCQETTASFELQLLTKILLESPTSHLMPLYPDFVVFNKFQPTMKSVASTRFHEKN